MKAHHLGNDAQHHGRWSVRSRSRTLSTSGLAALSVATLGAAAIAAGQGAAADEVDCSTVPWMDQSRTPGERAQSLLNASTLHQKYRWLVEQPANSPTQTTFSGVTYPVQVPCTPTVVYTDGPDGVRFTDGVTAFPAPIAVASSWDEAAQYEKSVAQGAEAFDKRKNVLLGPGIAGGRTPLSGRTPEYLGEDPILSGRLATAAVKGLQEGNPDKPVLSTLKHWVANEQELDRQRSSSNLDERTLMEIYDLPFAIAVAQAAPKSVMCSYNQINGTYACENPLLNDVLKDVDGFDGYVMSDFGAVHSTAPSITAGMDQELNRPRFLTPDLLDVALASGDLSETDIDSAALRVVRAYISAGLFDHPLPDSPVADASSAEHKAIARTLAQEGSVLLKNDDAALPLDVSDGDTIAVIGPTASATPTDGISSASVCALPWRFSGGTTLLCEDNVAPLDAITARAAEDGADVVYDSGSDPAVAAETAASADVAIVFGYQRMGEFDDLPDLHLQGNGDALASAVAGANPNTTVVLQTGSAVVMPWVDDVSAVLESWYAGEQQGPAIAALLFGDVNPSGKLPMTFPQSLEDTPTQTPEQYPGVVGPDGIRQVEYSEGLKVGYKWYESEGIEPLFAFGHGLSYTTFRYSHLQVTPTTSDGSKEIRVRFRLTNTGDRPGTEVAQAYVTLPPAAGEPAKRLATWGRVALGAGAFKNVELTLSARDLEDTHVLQVWDSSSGGWQTPTGTVRVSVGSSSETALSDTFTIHHPN